jgi:RNA polymerase sigma factor (sigma-70 family)
MRTPEGNKEPSPDQLAHEFLINRLPVLVRTICTRQSSTWLVDDCLQEAAVVLWRYRGRWLTLAAAARDLYVSVCIRRIVLRLSLEEARVFRYPDSLEHAEAAGLVSCVVFSHQDWVHWRADTLIEQVDRGDLCSALGTLSAAERDLLDLTFIHNLSDAEIAHWGGSTPASIKMRRHRLLARIRAHLCRKSLAEPK